MLVTNQMACTEKGVQEWNDEVRSLFSQLKPLEPPAYHEIFGKQPNSAELELGRMLFNDPILSRNNDVSCATCHLANHGFADGNSLNVGTMGIGGPTGDTVGRSFGQGALSLNRSLGDDGFGFLASRHMFRNSLSTINVVYRANETTREGLFWDGRFGSLDFQSLLPIHTAIEMCGTNPVPQTAQSKNPFRKGGPIFRKNVVINHSHSYDAVTGADTGRFNSQPESIEGVPNQRPDGRWSIPTRNECLAISIAKLRLVPGYRRLFKDAFAIDQINEKNLSRALSTFIMSHVATNTAFDRFLTGEENLSKEELRGLVMFMTPLGQKKRIMGTEIRGVGCASCHQPPLFGGNGFASLGVISDQRSSLTIPNNVSDLENGFFTRSRLQRGKLPQCHVKGVTTTKSYAPDIGRAGATFKRDDCFKFRIPPLRNIIETYPYFHHGTARAQGYKTENLVDRAYKALEQVISYHLRGPIDASFVSRIDYRKIFFDDLYQKDLLIPHYGQNFTNDQTQGDKYLPIRLKQSEMADLVTFLAKSLLDTEATKIGGFGNNISHPRVVTSGLSPSITRDQGHQGEIPDGR